MNAALYIKTIRVVSAGALFGKPRKPTQLGFAVIDSENGEQLSCHKNIDAARDAVAWHAEDRRIAESLGDMGF
jgi:alkylated DNA nucleotide flippase Atl1